MNRYQKLGCIVCIALAVLAFHQLREAHEIMDNVPVQSEK